MKCSLQQGKIPCLVTTACCFRPHAHGTLCTACDPSHLTTNLSDDTLFHLDFSVRLVVRRYDHHSALGYGGHHGVTRDCRSLLPHERLQIVNLPVIFLTPAVLPSCAPTAIVYCRVFNVAASIERHGVMNSPVTPLETNAVFP